MDINLFLKIVELVVIQALGAVVRVLGQVQVQMKKLDVVLVLQWQLFHFYESIYLLLDQNTTSTPHQKQVLTILHLHDNESHEY
jgi:hypothetical protein